MKKNGQRTKLIKLRIEKGLTQEQVATLIGVTRSTYANYETGYRNPSLQNIIKLKKIFNVSDDKIFLPTKDTISV